MNPFVFNHNDLNDIVIALSRNEIHSGKQATVALFQAVKIFQQALDPEMSLAEMASISLDSVRQYQCTNVKCAHILSQ